MHRPSRPFKRVRYWRRSIYALTALLVLAGCGINSDFGELNPTLVRDDIHDWVGRDNAEGRPISSSSFQLTDDERALRDLAYPLLEPPYNRQKWDSVAREYGLIRPNPHAAADRTIYLHYLMKIPNRSSAARYSQLIDDVRNDSTQLPQFFETAGRVLDMDQKRRKSLAYVSSLGDAERSDALNRIRENTRIVSIVRTSLAQRVSSYRFALERLVIMTPSPQTVEAERMLNKLQSEITYYRTRITPSWARQQSLAYSR